MPNSEKLIIEFKVEVVDPLSKFDGSNTNMDEVGMRSTRLELGNKWLMYYQY
ncbi:MULTISPECIES: hypothetical protein [Wolbachia]|uniref:hypothetical protein n=1 Tax=Wolbachia TaxID=953 RepID=UPI00142F05A6|nr:MULTISPECIES: hypothetical protein [unclassified Wolbachia]UFO00748.1 hypothetical protein LOK48_02080 [Wolbachia endosymbiont of Corcyra cephalonica]